MRSARKRALGPSILSLVFGGYADRSGLIPRSNTRRLGVGSALECWMRKQSAGRVSKFPGKSLSAMKRDSAATSTPPSRADIVQNG